MEIEEGTFKQLTGLEALDLSSNGLVTIPLELFNMNRLRNLYVHGNKLLHLNNDLVKVPKPIAAPLQIIDLANTYLYEIPNFGILPDLWKLNVSGNPLTKISADQFSPLCALTKIDFNDTEVPNCQCHALTRYLSNRDVVVDNLKCEQSTISK